MKSVLKNIIVIISTGLFFITLMMMIVILNVSYFFRVDNVTEGVLQMNITKALGEMENSNTGTLIKHLHLKKATWKDERCASMRFIARSYINLKRYDEAEMWLLKAIKEAPYLRDPYVEMMLLKYKLNDYKSIIKYGEEALKIKNNEKSYINEPFSWNETIYDLLSLAYYYTGNTDKAIQNINIAIEINPNDQRLLNNKQIFLQHKNLE